MKNPLILLVIILLSTLTYSQSTEQDCENARKIYLQQNPDVAKAGMNAWSHYISYGKREGRIWPTCSENNQNSISTPKETTNAKKIGNYEFIISNDKLNWMEVNNYCEKLGKDWFLPSKSQMIFLVESFSFGAEKQFWTSNEGTSGNSPNYVGKQMSNSDYDVAEALDLKTKKTVDLYKSSKAYYIVARSLGNCFDVVKNNLNSSYSLGDIKVSKFEFKDVTYNQAKVLCNNLGEGWRMPTIEELELIKKSGKSCEKDLSTCFYFSQTRTCENCYDSYWAVSFESGKKIMFDKNSNLKVIPVYSSPKPKLETWKFSGFEVCKNIYGPMTVKEAQSFCATISDNVNNQWRITTMQELSSMKNYKKDLPNMVGKTFMSYTPGNKNYFSREFLSIVEITPIGQQEKFWQGGSENTKYYFFMSR